LLICVSEGLKYPCYQEKEIVCTGEELLSDKDLFVLMNYESGSQILYWNNLWVDIGKGKKY